MENVQIITIYAKEIKTEKNKFLTFTTRIKDTYYKVKFTREVRDIPAEKGTYELTIDLDNVSIQCGEVVTTKSGKQVQENDTLWIKHIVGIRKYTQDDYKEVNRLKVEELFK